MTIAPLHFSVKEHTVPCQYIREYPGATLSDQEDTLKLHVKQYKPKDQSQDRPGAVTIIGAHANAFPKELYEPFWDELYYALKERGQAIKSIWIADIATQGKSGVFNEDKLGNDHPVIHDATSKSNNTRPDSSFARSSTFRRDLWPSRAQAAVSFKRNKFYQTWDPRVLDLWLEYGLRELPTAIYPEDAAYSPESEDSESNRAEGSPVTLTTTKANEVHMFLRPNFNGQSAKGENIVDSRTQPDIDLSTSDTFPFYRPEPPAVFKKLAHLRPSTLYLFGDKSELSQPESRLRKLEITGTGVGGSGGVKAGRVKEVVLEAVGHLIPMIAPKDSGFWTADFLASDLKRWRKEEDDFKREWEAKSKLEKMTISEEWKKNIGGDPRIRSPPKL